MLSKRPLMWMSLSFVAGMYILSFFDFLNVLFVSFIALFTCLLLLFRKVKNAIVLLICVILFISGSVRYDYAADVKMRDLYSKINTTVTAKAEITEDVKISEKTVSFVADVICVTDETSTIKTTEKVKFIKYIKDQSEIDNFRNLKLGDIILTNAKITLPESAMNSGGFDYADYLKTENIFFQCETDDTSVEITDHINRSIRHSWANFRRRCISFFDDAFPVNEGAVLKAFVTGDSSGISKNIEESFSNSGLSHILAVSGLHVSVFISLVVSLLRLFNVSKRKEMLFSVVAAFFFVFFTGASVSALRAGILAVFALIAKLIYRKSDPLTTLSLAAFILALIDPLVVYSASFMLSFAATAGILLFYNTISSFFRKIYKKLDEKSVAFRVSRNICDSLAVGISAQIFVVPLLVYLFSGFSVMSIISTMFVTPFLPFLLAGGILFIAASFISSTIALPFGGFIYVLAKLLMWISDYFGGFSFSKVLFGEITPFLLLMYGVFILLAMSVFKKKKTTYIIAIISLTILSGLGVINNAINYDTAQVTFINVGQGDCALFKAPGDCDVLIDAGGYGSSDGTGEHIIAPYLIKNGVTDIEYVIISHMHKDHIVGLIGLLDKLELDNLIIPYGQIDTEDGREIIKKAKENDVNVINFTAGDKLKIDDNIEFLALSPDENQGKFANSIDDLGIVIRLDYGDSSFLFTGDITTDIERYLIKSYPDKLEADVLKVSHHGSKYSSSKEFLDVVKPKYSYIPVGNNTYGHPTPEAIERLKKSGCEIYRADMHKDVTFYFDSKNIKGVSY